MKSAWVGNRAAIKAVNEAPHFQAGLGDRRIRIYAGDDCAAGLSIAGGTDGDAKNRPLPACGGDTGELVRREVWRALDGLKQLRIGGAQRVQFSKLLTHLPNFIPQPQEFVVIFPQPVKFGLLVFEMSCFLVFSAQPVEFVKLLLRSALLFAQTQNGFALGMSPKRQADEYSRHDQPKPDSRGGYHW